MNKYLKDIFIHLDGLAMAPIYEIISHIPNYKRGINPHASGLGSYTFILCAVLKAQNMMKEIIRDEDRENIKWYEWTEYGEKILLKQYSFSGIRDYYISAIDLIEGKKSDNFIDNFNNVYSIYLKSIEEDGQDSLISKHLEGALIAPILIYYKYTAQDSNILIDILENHQHDFLIFLEKIKFIENKDLTEKGSYLLSKTYAYGVTDSYMRTFICLNYLCCTPNKGFYSGIYSPSIDPSSGSHERHVNRALNVWGSGKSHTTYFKYIDSYIIEMFNKPIEEQPKGIADMGCGDGSFLHHINKLIKNRTLRGEYLDSYPLVLIGADFNQAALDETRKMFESHKNQPLTVLADISKPDEYAEKVRDKYSLDISDFLNVRSFLDHNRTYDGRVSSKFSTSKLGKKDFKNITTNSFVWKGEYIPKRHIQSNLVRHFEKWKKYISKYGLLTLELHCININKVYENIGKIPMTAYIATHGFSDQFIIEYEVYRECIDKAGLKVNANYEVTFPSEDLKMISINLIN